MAALAAETAEAKLGFIVCQNFDDWPLYKRLASVTTADDKRAAAHLFISDHASADPAFVATLSGTMALMPAARAAISQRQGEWPLDAQKAFLLELLALPADSKPAAFLSGPEWTAFVPDAWQSMFALALAGSPSQAQIAGQLVDTLRMGHYITCLVNDEPALITPKARAMIVNALPVFPDAVTAQPPSLERTVGSGTEP